MKINVKMNPAYIPYFDKPQFTQIFYGGSSSGKSYFLAQKIVVDNMQGVNWLVCKAVATTMKKSVFNEIKKSISNMGLSKYYNINKSDMTITNNLNRSQIIFMGLDDPEKVKSVTPQKGVIDRIFIEEATDIKETDYLQLKKRLRGLSKFEKCIIMAFNPIFKLHWIYEKFFADNWKENKTSYEDEKLSILKTTYKDNKFLTRQDMEILEDESDPYFYNVYTLGNWGVLQGLVFKKFIERDFNVSEISKKNGVVSAFGLDFGYTNDPTALFCGLIDEKDKKIYVFDEIYEKGLINSEIANRIIEKGYSKEKIIADSAEPKSIDELYLSGINRIEGAKKKEILYGIQKLMNYEFIIHPNCKNFINEINNYSWDTKNGVAINKPIDSFNHLIDAMRYAVMPAIDGGVFSFE